MMEKVDATGAEPTMLVTLYLRALEGRSKDSILGDHVAAEVVDRINYDFAKLVPRGGAGNRFMLALRAKQLDDWAAEFLRRHTDATVLHLGCGLDSRAFRLDLPADVRWFDIDLPDVIELRRRLYPEPHGYRMIGSSVTDHEWLDEVPTERPVLVIAEGLLMYLSGNDIKQLLHRFTDRFSFGELLFDGFAQWVVWCTQRLSKLMVRKGYSPYSTATRDGQEIERWNPRFRRVEDVPIVSQFAKVPGAQLPHRVPTDECDPRNENLLSTLSLRVLTDTQRYCRPTSTCAAGAALWSRRDDESPPLRRSSA